MRLKITRQLGGSIDGVQLSQFRLGQLYEVGTSLGSYLLAIGAAEPVMDYTPDRVVPLTPSISAGLEPRGRLSGSAASAADRPPRTRKK